MKEAGPVWMEYFLSLDCRKRLIATIEGGMSCSQAAQGFRTGHGAGVRLMFATPLVDFRKGADALLALVGAKFCPPSGMRQLLR